MRKLSSPSGIKCLKSLQEMEPPRTPDSVCRDGFFIVQKFTWNSSGDSGCPGGNLTPKTKSLSSAEQTICRSPMRLAREPAQPRRTHHWVGRAGSWGGRGGLYSRSEEEAGVWLTLSLGTDLASTQAHHHFKRFQDFGEMELASPCRKGQDSSARPPSS